ncbi:MAG: metallophosphoesterase, partial [Chitinophagaceae bacterium]
PYGSQGSFALLGNHEMYSSGRSYFTQLLPYMGNYVPSHDKDQQASFFCLENDCWRIIGLDTGYYSLKGWLGIKGNNKLDLHDTQKEWLRNTVRLSDDNRGLIFLSHHQCFSAFEDEFPKPAEFIASLLPAHKNVIWLWGHEHWFSVYGANKLANGATMYARCVGNSGMPVELNKKKEAKQPR